jgi:hypothetical protein
MEEHPTPIPVTDTNNSPRDVRIVPDHADHDSPAQSDARVIAATRQSEANKSRVDDQQKVSGMWESTQRLIAIAVVLDVLFVATVIVLIPPLLALTGHQADEAVKAAAVGGLLFLTGVSNLVIGFYFGRTNHQKVGGAATQSEQDMGR